MPWNSQKMLNFLNGGETVIQHAVQKTRCAELYFKK